MPYSFHRLDSFVGYESGMPSPEFYQRLWEHGAEAAGEEMLFETIEHLRKKKQRVSAADSIAALTLARGLKTLRGHLELSRNDVLDGLAAAIIKDALEAPLPWNRRGTLASGTDPMLVEMVSAFSGERIGKLAPGTPRPPLVLDVHEQLRRAAIEPARTTAHLEVSLVDAEGLARSRVLHRLRVLEVPGFVLTRRPSLTRADTTLTEAWAITQLLEAEPALIEAAAYGATLEAAAAARLEEGIGRAAGIRELARLLDEAALVGIDTLTGRLVAEGAPASREPSPTSPSSAGPSPRSLHSTTMASCSARPAPRSSARPSRRRSSAACGSSRASAARPERPRWTGRSPCVTRCASADRSSRWTVRAPRR